MTEISSSLQVLPFDDNICLREPCENYMKCVSVLKFDSSPPFIASETVLFRPIHPINGLRCRCPVGFTGDYCETEIDLCYSGPCMNNGRCRSREGGYTCECLEDFTGELSTCIHTFNTCTNTARICCVAIKIKLLDLHFQNKYSQNLHMICVATFRTVWQR